METEWDLFMNRWGELFRTEILKQNQLERNASEGASWKIRNQVAVEVGTKYFSVLLLETIFFDNNYGDVDSKKLYNSIQKHMKERYMDPLFFRYVFKIHSKELLSEQIRLKRLVHFLLSEVTGRAAPKVFEESLSLKEQSKDSSFLSSIQKNTQLELSFSNSFDVRSFKEADDQYEQKLTEFSLSNTIISPENAEIVNNPSKIGDPKTYMTQLENKVRQVNPRFEKEAEVNKVYRVKCFYEFGPNQYTPKKVLLTGVGQQMKTTNAQKQAVKAVLKVLFERYPSVMAEVPFKSALLSKDSQKN